MALAAAPAAAQDATWNLNGTGNFNAAANWTPSTVPTGTAFFGTSNQTSVSITVFTTVVGGFTFGPGASNYTFSFPFARTLNFTGAGIVSDGGSASFDISNTAILTFSNSSAAGSATLNVAADGKLQFNDSSSAGNATIVNAGNNLVFDTHSTAANATITNNGILRFSQTSTAASAAITNNGTASFVASASAGTATITNNVGGVLNFFNTSSAGSATVTNNAELDFFGSASGGTARFINGAAANIDLSSLNTSSGTMAGSIEGSGTVSLGSKNFAVGSNGLSTEFSGILQDGGRVGGTGGSLTKTGAGTLTLSGLSTYTGATTVSAGTLLVNGSIGASSGVTVDSGASLGGTGTVAATTINSGGALTPGNGVGTIAVNGGLTFNGGSKYNIDVSPSTADTANVTGTASLTGGTVNVTSTAASYTLGRQYTILSATLGLGGTTFAGLVWPNFTGALSYDANNAYLTLTGMTLGVGTSLDGNQQNVAGAINGFFNNGGVLPAGFAALLGQSGAQLGNSFSQLSGEAGTGAQQSGFAVAGQSINVVFDNGFIDAGGHDEGGAPLGYAATPKLSRAAQQAYAAVMPRDRAVSFDTRWRLWGAAYGGNGIVNGDNAIGSNTTTSRVYGASAGATYRVSPSTQFGFSLGGAGSSFGIANGFGSGKADMFNAAVYGRQTFGPGYVAGALGYTWQDATTDRTVTIAGTDVLHASFHPQALTARLEAGRRYAWPAFGIAPYAAMQTTSVFMPSYGETATSGSSQFALNFASTTVTATRGELGARWDKSVAVNGGVLTVKAKTAWAHDWNTERAATPTFQALPGAAFTVNGAKPSADAALLSLGAQMAWARGWSVAANVDGEFSANSRSYAGRGAIRYAW